VKRVGDNTFLLTVAQVALEEAAEHDGALDSLLDTLDYGPHEVRYATPRGADIQAEIEDDDDRFNLIDHTGS
jgi:leucyl aminopeptidase (aminopeptidase T)